MKINSNSGATWTKKRRQKYVSYSTTFLLPRMSDIFFFFFGLGLTHPKYIRYLSVCGAQIGIWKSQKSKFKWKLEFGRRTFIELGIVDAVIVPQNLRRLSNNNRVKWAELFAHICTSRMDTMKAHRSIFSHCRTETVEHFQSGEHLRPPRWYPHRLHVLKQMYNYHNIRNNIAGIQQ